MMHVLSGRRRGALFVCAAVVTVVACSAAAAARIWDRPGPFQACVERRFEAWVNARAELVANEDPKASEISDAAVAKWTVETLQACGSQAGSGDKDAEAHFSKYMARWREHIDERAQRIADKIRPD